MVAATFDTSIALGRSPEQLSIRERRSLEGSWLALEIYDPKTLPLRRIQAVAASPADCAAELCRRGLDPRNFEFARATTAFGE